MQRTKNFRGETLAEARAQLVNVLKAQKSWLTEYAEAYIDDFETMAHEAIQRALDGPPPPDDTAARKLYNASLGDAHNLHCRAWSELSEAEREHWREQA